MTDKSGDTHIDVNSGGTCNYNPNAHTVINTTDRPKAYLITEIINCLDQRAEDIPDDEDLNIDPFYIDKKVEFNKLERWAEYVEEYTPYYSTVNSIYAEFDKQGRNKSRRVMIWLKARYKALYKRFKYDELFDELLRVVCNDISSDHHLSPEIREEDIEYNARIVLVDAFIKCEIFEKPK